MMRAADERRERVHHHAQLDEMLRRPGCRSAGRRRRPCRECSRRSGTRLRCRRSACRQARPSGTSEEVARSSAASDGVGAAREQLQVSVVGHGTIAELDAPRRTVTTARIRPRSRRVTLGTGGGGWLGRKDSNLRIRDPKSGALPLGHAPSVRRGLRDYARGLAQARPPASAQSVILADVRAPRKGVPVPAPVRASLSGLPLSRGGQPRPERGGRTPAGRSCA